MRRAMLRPLSIVSELPLALVVGEVTAFVVETRFGFGQSSAISMTTVPAVTHHNNQGRILLSREPSSSVGVSFMLCFTNRHRAGRICVHEKAARTE